MIAMLDADRTKIEGGMTWQHPLTKRKEGAFFPSLIQRDDNFTICFITIIKHIVTWEPNKLKIFC